MAYTVWLAVGCRVMRPCVSAINRIALLYQYVAINTCVFGDKVLLKSHISVLISSIFPLPKRLTYLPVSLVSVCLSTYPHNLLWLPSYVCSRNF